MRRTLLVGGVGCGKTTLLQRLTSRELSYAKTQSITVAGGVFDTPGEYLDHRFYKHALRLASHEVEIVALLQSATAQESRIPPAFTTMFTKPVIGVVTKIDVASHAQRAHAASWLRVGGVAEIFELSALTGEGCAAFADRLA